MGAGKSTVGPIVAGRIGAAFVDLDAEIEKNADATIATLFATEGEAGFRAREAELVATLANRENIVVALGGGTVTSRRVRRQLLAAGTLITLHARASQLLERVGEGEGRPLLQGNAQEKLEALLRDRRAMYLECHGVVNAEGDVAEVADRVVAIAARAPLSVPLGSRSYRVEVGQSCLHWVDEAVAGRRALVVCDENTRRYADRIKGSSWLCLRSGEEHKNLETVARIWEAAFSARLDRRSVFVAVGGGVAGDLTGFAASAFLRGVPFVQVPTTSLAMVDSSVGGKTGVNNAHGKNLIGAFHQPERVVCDVATLSTLSERDRAAGWAEAVKSAWLAGPEALERLAEDAVALREGDLDASVRAVRMSVALKSRIVADDEHERGARALLNFGHTIAHALESEGEYRRYRHGEAVALGMLASVQVARRLGLDVDHAAAGLLREVLGEIGLPIELPSLAGLAPFIANDKKRVGDALGFINPAAPGEARIVKVALPAFFEAIRQV